MAFDPKPYGTTNSNPDLLADDIAAWLALASGDGDAAKLAALYNTSHSLFAALAADYEFYSGSGTVVYNLIRGGSPYTTTLYKHVAFSGSTALSWAGTPHADFRNYIQRSDANGTDHLSHGSHSQTNKYSAELIFRVDSAQGDWGWGTLWGMYDEPNDSLLGFSVSGDGYIVFGGSSQEWMYTSSPVAFDVWHHAIVSLDPDGTSHLWVDGSLACSSSENSDFGSGTTFVCMLGNNYGYPVIGAMALARLWKNRALTSDAASLLFADPWCFSAGRVAATNRRRRLLIMGVA